MARKPFFTDGMTVKEILDLGANVLNSLGSRDMSRALRTVALAANKRINRLLSNAKKVRTGTYDKKTGKPLYNYIEKASAKYPIATDALNYITDDGRRAPRFGVGKKNLNEMRSEFARIREFMGLETSTIKGAVNVRKGRESRILGETREEHARKAVDKYVKEFKKMTGRKPAKVAIEKVRKAAIKEHLSMSSLAWHYFRTFLESEGLPNNPYSKFEGSTEVISLIGSRTAQGQSEAEIHQAARDLLQGRYEESVNDLEMAFEPDSDDGYYEEY